MLAHKHQLPVPVLSFGDEDVQIGDLREGLPDNPIVEEAINI